MKRRWVTVLLIVALGALPAITLADTMNVDVPVVVTWHHYATRWYDTGVPDWQMYIDLELRCDYWDDTLTQTIATGIEPFREIGRGQIAEPFIIGWPGSLRNTAYIYGRVRWHADGDPHDIVGDWTYIQDITGTSTVLYFPLGIAPAQ